MKKLIIALLFSITAIPQILAQDRSGMFQVTLSDGSPLVITVDDRRYTKVGPSLTIGHLPAGKHTIKVYSFKPYKHRDGGKARLLYTGNITITPGKFYHGIVNVNGGSMRVSSEPIANNGGNYNGNQNQDQAVVINNNTGQERSREMADLKANVDSKATDNDKLKVLKSKLADRHYSTAQVDDMLHWLNFDDSKLEFAKWAYSGVSDPQNYVTLENNFSFGNSRENFQKFINSKK